jgi:hypothetical protein
MKCQGIAVRQLLDFFAKLDMSAKLWGLEPVHGRIRCLETELIREYLKKTVKNSNFKYNNYAT